MLVSLYNSAFPADHRLYLSIAEVSSLDTVLVVELHWKDYICTVNGNCDLDDLVDASKNETWEDGVTKLAVRILDEDAIQDDDFPGRAVVMDWLENWKNHLMTAEHTSC